MLFSLLWSISYQSNNKNLIFCRRGCGRDRQMGNGTTSNSRAPLKVDLFARAGITARHTVRQRLDAYSGETWEIASVSTNTTGFDSRFNIVTPYLVPWSRAVHVDWVRTGGSHSVFCVTPRGAPLDDARSPRPTLLGLPRGVAGRDSQCVSGRRHAWKSLLGPLL